MKLLLIIVGGLAALLVVALVAFNLLISPSAVRDHIAARIMEQSGRVLEVNGPTSLLFLPNPHIVLNQASIRDPEEKAGAIDLEIDRLTVDLSILQLLSRTVDASEVTMERPILTVYLDSGRADQGVPERRGDAGGPLEHHAALDQSQPFIEADIAGDKPHRDVSLRDVRIEDGTLVLVKTGRANNTRIEHIDGDFSLPHVTETLSGNGKFEWQDSRIGFDLALTSPAELHAGRQARLDLALGGSAGKIKFAGVLGTRPDVTADGDLTASELSVPALLALAGNDAPVANSAAGGLSSHVAVKPGEIDISNARFDLGGTSGQGQAVLTLGGGRPYLRAALAFARLDLDPIFAAVGHRAAEAPAGDASATPDAESTPASQASQPNPPAATTDDPAASDQAAAVQPTPQPVDHAPGLLDADVNLAIGQANAGNIAIGRSTIGVSYRDGVLNTTLSDMQLYGGHGHGKLTLSPTDGGRSVAADLSLENVAALPLLKDAAHFDWLSGRANLTLQLTGAGANGEAIKSSLNGRGTIGLADGAIEGVDINAAIQNLGNGDMPQLKRGPGAETAFSSLGGSFTLTNGIAQTDDLALSSPLLQVKASGTVDLPHATLDLLAEPKIVADPDSKGGGNALAGLSVPVHIQGPLSHPSFRPEIKQMFANPDQAERTLNQVGEILQKKFKGKKGAMIGKILGGMKIRSHRIETDDDAPGPDPSAVPDTPQAAAPSAPPAEKNNDDQEEDPDLKRILR